MTRLVSVLILATVLLGPACVAVAPVVQGTVVAVEPGGGVVRVQDELAPDKDPMALDITTAEIGSAPREGDVVRIVYRAGPGSNQALRVMNLSRHQAGQ